MCGPRRPWCILQPGAGESTMAIRLHGSARTTPGIRSGLRLATGSHRSLAKLYGINPKTVAKWRSHTSVLDAPTGPHGRAIQHLPQEQEHLAIARHRQGHLSLDDLMGQLLETAPKLSRSALLLSTGPQLKTTVGGSSEARHRTNAGIASHDRFKRKPIGHAVATVQSRHRPVSFSWL